MLLRRVTQHIRTQNWFAVIVDFVIVVVGVFVGLQVQDWNDARKERLEEQALLNRLYSETQALIESHKEELKALRARGEVLTGVNPVLFSQEPPRRITPVECRYIAGSHVYRRPPDELPVLDEILETGRFGLLQDHAVKDNLRAYVMLRERARAYYSEAVNELFRLHSRHPSLIVIHRVQTTSDSDVGWDALSGDGFRWMPECDSEKMKEDTAFLNEYVDNLSRISSLTGFVAQRRDHLIELESILTEAISNESRQD
jgi:hypothetical protein